MPSKQRVTSIYEDTLKEIQIENSDLEGLWTRGRGGGSELLILEREVVDIPLKISVLDAGSQAHPRPRELKCEP